MTIVTGISPVTPCLTMIQSVHMEGRCGSATHRNADLTEAACHSTWHDLLIREEYISLASLHKFSLFLHFQARLLCIFFSITTSHLRSHNTRANRFTSDDHSGSELLTSSRKDFGPFPCIDLQNARHRRLH